MNGYGIRLSLIGIMIATLLSAAFIKQASNIQQHDYVIDSLKNYQHLDARLDQNILMARYGLLPYYDPINDHSGSLLDIIKGLQSPSLELYHQGDSKLDTALDNLSKDAQQKLGLIEHFKSRNAVLKNSLRYLPVAVHQLIDTLPDTPLGQQQTSALNDLLGAILSYNITADDFFRDRVTEILTVIEQQKSKLAPDQVEKVDHILNHTSTIIQEKAYVDSLIEELILKHNTDTLTNTFEAYKEYNAARTATADKFKILLYLLTITLLIYVGYAIIKLRSNSHQLKRANAELGYQKFALDQHSIVSTADASGNITYANQRLVEISQFSFEELLGKTHAILKSGQQSPEFYSAMWNTIQQGKVWHGELRNQKKNGDYYWVNATIVPFLNESGEPYQYISIHTDITKQKAIEEALFQEKELAQTTLHSISDGVITTDEQGRITYLNPTAAQLTGHDAQKSIGKHIDQVLDVVDENNHKPITGIIHPCLERQDKVSLTNTSLRHYKHQHTHHSIELAASPLLDRQHAIQGAVVVLHDVTETRTLTRQMSYLASHDPLTGLVNRREFKERLSHMLDSARTYDHHHALCYIDLDQFKIINDTCGHVAGDELLKQLSNLLTDIVRSRDTLARLGGDEFGLLLGECPLDRALLIAQEICDTVKNFRFVWDKKTFEVGASIGVVQITRTSESPTHLMSLADTACYAAKDKGRNRVHLYQENDAELQQRYGEMQWIPRLSKALTEDRFVLYCQPMRALNSTAQGEHFEVLVRLQTEEGELVPPGAFIPAAERYNMMPTIDRWVIKQTFATCAHHYDAKAADSLDTCAINLSGHSLNEAGFLEFIIEELDTWRLPAHMFCFEVTETAAITNLTIAIAFMHKLKEKGCQFSLDDFGSGVSSFSYLKKLPVDYLKIDGNFIIDMVNDPIDRAMVKSINQVGHVMGLKTIAEYVENDALTALAAEIGIDYAQGYGISKPILLDQYLQGITGDDDVGVVTTLRPS